MDEDRKIRFLVAPLLFLTSLAWGFARDPTRKLTEVLTTLTLDPDKITDLIAVLAGGGIAIFTLGYVIGTSTYVFLRFFFWLKACVRGGSQFHEISFSDETLGRVWNKVLASGQANRKLELYAGVAFDHGVLQTENEGVHRWVTRRWSAFSVAATSITGLGLSLVIGYLAKIPLSVVEWWVPVVIVSVILCASAILAWRDTMGMLSFQATLESRSQKGDG